ncbi:hypothetical protein Tco_1279318, partial [Tanacetum coccineum]
MGWIWGHAGRGKSVRLRIPDAVVADQIIADQNAFIFFVKANSLYFFLKYAQALYQQAAASHRKAEALHLCKYSAVETNLRNKSAGWVEANGQLLEGEEYVLSKAMSL